jgi:hypothetical protein
MKPHHYFILAFGICLLGIFMFQLIKDLNRIAGIGEIPSLLEEENVPTNR